MRKFLFEQSFDPEALEAEHLRHLEAERRRLEAEASAEAEAEPEPEPPPPTFSEEEMEAARRQAYADGAAAGRTAGEAAALQSREEAIAGLLRIIAAETSDIAARQSEAIAGLGDAAVQVALAVCSKMLPRLIERDGGGEIENLIRQCLDDLMEEPRIVVRVNDDLLDDIRDRVDRVKAETGYAGAFVLLADAGLAPGDCRVEWADGGAERLGNQVWREVEEVIARLQSVGLSRDNAPGDGPEPADQRDQPCDEAPDQNFRNQNAVMADPGVHDE